MLLLKSKSNLKPLKPINVTNLHQIFKRFVAMVSSKKFVMSKHFVGMPQEADFNLVEEHMPDLKQGG